MDRLSKWIDKEWLLTNGLGSYMCGTPLGLNTRRYHGLFVAALSPPVSRHVLLSKYEESLRIGDTTYELSCNEYPGVIHPHGYQWLADFTVEPLPKAIYEIDGCQIEKSYLMVQGEQLALVRYTRCDDGPESVHLDVRPLVAGRDYHHCLTESPEHIQQVTTNGRTVSFVVGNRVPLVLRSDRATFQLSPDWYRRFQHRIEAYRGLDAAEDLFCPGSFQCELEPGDSCTFLASLEPVDMPDFDAYQTRELVRRRALVPTDWDPVSARLAVAADAFIVRRGVQRHTILAGYPWFTDWGRDTMIALPGLTLVTGRYEIARSILETFAAHTSRGMLPNRFPDVGDEPQYNTVDGTLWFFWAVHEYLEHTSDWEFASQLWGVLTGIIDWHIRGTRYGIQMDEDGLLLAGNADTQLTWMDAKVGDWVITPRWGKAVEINALWYNALRISQHIADELGFTSQVTRYSGLADRVHEHFVGTFWNADAGCLFDTVNERGSDAAIRPNQLLAASLPYPLLTREQAQQMVQVAERELLTPMGLRSLAPSNPGYVGHYGGSPGDRDAAYHQGTVWAWWIGPFITAMTYAYGGSAEARAKASGHLQGLIAHLDEAGLGTVSEIADGDPPHTPRGCFAQAWSVAELLRVLREDLG